MRQQFYQPERRKRQVEQPDDDGGIYPSFYTGPEGKTNDPTQTLGNIDDVLAQNDAVRANIPSSDDLRNSEESAAPAPAGAAAVGGSADELGKIGKGFSLEDEKSKGGLARKIALNRRNKLLAGGGLGGLLLAIILSAFFALPLKVQHIANNLQQEFFAAAEQATEDMTDALMRSYIVKYLAPGMVKNNCTSTRINKSCVNTSTSNNIVGVLYNGWRDAKIENKLADKGIVIEREGGRFFLTTPSGRADLGTYNPNNPDAFSQSARRELSRTEIRKQMKIALKDETLWNRGMYRYKVGGLMERKYGVQRCIVACQTRDKWADTKDEYKKRFARSLISQRVLNPLSEFSTLALECATEGFKCTDEGEVDENGERPSQLELQYRQRLADFRNKYPDVDIADLDREAEELRSKGIIEHMLSKVIGKTATKAIPIIGWVDLGAQMMAGATKVGPAAIKLTYVANSTAAVQAYMLLRTNADEIKTGEIDAEMTGSVATALSETDGVNRTDQNGVGAEGSPLYAALMGSTTSKTRTASVSATAYAASSRVYGCEDNDNKPVPVGMFVCPVERLDAVTAVGTVFDKISDIANSPMMKGGAIFAKIWVNTGGKILSLGDKVLGPIISAVIDALPGDAEKKLADLARPIMETLMSYIVKPIIGTLSSGARLFNLMATGADVAGNDFAHYGLGAGSASYKQVHDIRVAREQERYEEFQSRSMFARMFSTDTDYSLVSKAAMATPLSASGNISPSFMSILSNPVRAFSSGISAVTAAPTASAKVAMTQDHAGVTQYAYDPNDPIFDSDPEAKYDELDCDNVEVTKNWGNKAQNNPNTEMLDHKPGDTNPCLLIRSAAGSAGVRYTDEVLTDEERAELNGTVTTGGLGGNLRVASYNILGASHTDGASDQKPNKDWRDRLDVTINTIRTNNIELIGFQEFQGKQRERFLEKMGGTWAITKAGDHQLTANAIGWDTTKFEKVGEEKIMPNLLYFNNGKLAAPYVKLKYTLTGQEFYVLNTHDPANTKRSGCDCASERLHNATQHVALVNSLKSQGLPIIFTGDFNSGYASSPSGNGSTVGDTDANATYCVLTRGGTLDDAYDLYKKRPVKCPNPIEKEDRANSANGIDHIFVTNGIGVTGFDRLPGGYTNNGSDHPTVYADISLPGSDTGGAETGAVKMKDDYKTECGPMKAGGSPGLACDGQCVDFVKFRLKKHINKQLFASLGNGKNVVDTLGGAGYNYKVNNTPAVNAVASWPAGGVAGNPANKQFGHTAVVSRVNPDNSIVVEEYNATIPAYTYGSRTIPAASAKLLRYAHTEGDFK